MPKPPQDRDRLLRTFVAVARAGSLRGAAFALGITQAAASKQISALEARLGVVLFNRHGRGMRLTASGSVLLRQAGPGLDAIDAALAQIQTDDGRVQGQVGIATVNTLAAYLVPEVVARIRSETPGRRVCVTNASSPDVVEQVVRGLAEIGLVYDLAVDTDAVELQRLYLENVCAYCRQQAHLPDAMALTELVDEPWIVPPRPYALRRLIDRVFPAGLNVAIESNSVSVSLDLVQRGVGLAMLPSALPAAWVESRGLRRVQLLGAELRRPVVLIHRRQSAALPAPVRDAIQTIRQCAAKWRG